MMLASNAQNVILRTYLTVRIVFAPKSSILNLIIICLVAFEETFEIVNL